MDHGQLDFDDNLGGFDSRLVVAALYSALKLTPNVYLNAVTGGGLIDLYEIERSFLLGPSRESYSAESDGYYTLARFGGGLIGRVGSWIINPSASISFERVVIDGYTESEGAANVAFGDLEFDSTRFTASLSVTNIPKDPSDWRLSLRASLEYDLEDEDLIVKTGPSQEYLGEVVGPRPDETFGYLSAQFVKTFGDQSSLSLNTSGVVGLDGAIGFTGSATYRKNF